MQDNKSYSSAFLSDEPTDELENIEIYLLLEGMFRYYGYDFRNYSLPFLRRRIWNRLRAEQLPTITALTNKIMHNKSTMHKLIHDFSIHVTEMFRDPGFFLSLRRKVVPLLRELPYLRIWHAGCATGEEVVSMAILLQEENLYHKTRIYATDLEENVLKEAKQGAFPLPRMREYTQNYMLAGGTKAFSEYYKVKLDHAYFHSDLLEHVVYAQHNLAVDSSFNEFHMIICRNVLIYFNRELQSRVHELFYESLSPLGILGLGDKEGMAFSPYAPCYEKLDATKQIYRKLQ